MSMYPDDFNAELHDLLFSDREPDERTTEAREAAERHWKETWIYADTLGIPLNERFDFVQITMESGEDFHLRSVYDSDAYIERYGELVADYRIARDRDRKDKERSNELKSVLLSVVKPGSDA